MILLSFPSLSFYFFFIVQNATLHSTAAVAAEALVGAYLQPLSTVLASFAQRSLTAVLRRLLSRLLFLYRRRR